MSTSSKSRSTRKTTTRKPPTPWAVEWREKDEPGSRHRLVLPSQKEAERKAAALRRELGDRLLSTVEVGEVRLRTPPPARTRGTRKPPPVEPTPALPAETAPAEPTWCVLWAVWTRTDHDWIGRVPPKPGREKANKFNRRKPPPRQRKDFFSEAAARQFVAALLTEHGDNLALTVKPIRRTGTPPEQLSLVGTDWPLQRRP
jgi:hypothetical protein